MSFSLFCRKLTLVEMWRRNWKEKNVQATKSVKFQRKRVTSANTKMKTIVTAQFKYPSILKNALSSGQDAARAFLGRGNRPAV